MIFATIIVLSGFFGKLLTSGLFIVGLLVAVGVINAAAVKFLIEHSKHGRTALSYLIEAILGGVFLLFAWWLSGGSFVATAFIHFLVGASGVAIGHSLLAVLGNAGELTGSRRTWAYAEAAEQPTVSLFVGVVLIVAFVWYMLFMPWTLFANDVPSDFVSRRVALGSTFVFVILPRYVFWFYNARVVSSNTVDSDTRWGSYLLIVGATMSLTYALSVFLAAYRWTGPIWRLELFGGTQVIAPVLCFIIWAGFCGTSVIPMVAGERRYCQYREQNLRRQISTIEYLIDALLSTSVESYSHAVAATTDALTKEIEIIERNAPYLRMILRGREAFADNHTGLYDAIQRAKDRDPRFEMHNASKELLEKCHSTLAELKREDAFSMPSLALALANSFEHRRTRLAEQLEACRPMHIGQVVILAAVMTIVITVASSIGIAVEGLLPKAESAGAESHQVDSVRNASDLATPSALMPSEPRNRSRRNSAI